LSFRERSPSERAEPASKATGLLTIGWLAGLPFPRFLSGQAANYVPLTVAGQWRILTAFPYIASGLEYSRTPGCVDNACPAGRGAVQADRCAAVAAAEIAIGFTDERKLFGG